MDMIYREHILDHYKNPRNHGNIEHPDISFHDNNPLCGDEIKIEVKLDAQTHISDVKFTGRGCAISQCAASMLTEELKDKTLEEAKKITNQDIIGMLAIPISPVRMKCAILSLKVLEAGIYEYENKQKLQKVRITDS
ncbi:SUF system NifU family Fe-S cluster assembly protein [Candidatus Woesearchaeota archaeon]|nr:SUF system NifU family Fe-S cluster assembly protein [Candidatus Woesearchaeota archaeon]